jgi:hypothetical protein
MGGPHIVGDLDGGKQQGAVAFDLIGGRRNVDCRVGFKHAFDMQRQNLTGSRKQRVKSGSMCCEPGEIGKRGCICGLAVLPYDRDENRHGTNSSWWNHFAARRRKLRTFSLKIANQQGHGLKYGKHLRPAEGGKPGRRKRCDCGKQTEKPAKKARQPAAISAETRD